MSSAPLLFVYGTLLRSATRNRFSRYLRLHSDFVGAALMRGRLYGLKRYPCMRPPREEDDWVAGEVVALRTPDPTLAVLDAYEDREYRRIRRWAVLESGKTVNCWVYEYTRPIPRHRRIDSGAWENKRCF